MVSKRLHPGLSIIREYTGGWHVIHTQSGETLVGGYKQWILAEDFAYRASQAADFTKSITTLRPQLDDIRWRILHGQQPLPVTVVEEAALEETNLEEEGR